MIWHKPEARYTYTRVKQFMANVLNGNTWYVDTQYTSEADDLVRKQALVAYILVTATGANGKLVLADSSSNPAIKFDLRVPVSGTTEIFRFEAKPALFPNGIRALTLTNAVATVVIVNPGG